jgi:hypothetical protein
MGSSGKEQPGKSYKYWNVVRHLPLESANCGVDGPASCPLLTTGVFEDHDFFEV